jgi:hypothetical protein
LQGRRVTLDQGRFDPADGPDQVRPLVTTTHGRALAVVYRSGPASKAAAQPGLQK